MFIHPNLTEFASSREASLCVRSLVYCIAVHVAGETVHPGAHYHLSISQTSQRI